MGDAGEGLVDAEARIAERLEEVARERAARREAAPRDPDTERELESLRLGRTELERQLASTTHERRKDTIAQAIAELDRRMTELRARLESPAERATPRQP
jgi:hypothetical protein